MRPAPVALLAAAAAHLAFQATVTAVVYPALASTPPAGWAEAHDRHSRAVTPVVATVYGALLAGCGWALASAPGPATTVAAAGAAVSVGGTALVAAPTHGRLGRGYDARLVRRLIAVDRVRAGGAAVCLVGALGGIVRARQAPRTPSGR